MIWILVWTASYGAAQMVVAQDTTLLGSFKYRNIGPARGGRVTAVTGIASRQGTFYMGATGGGVWKTTDYGTTWKNVSDGFFASPSIGDINVVQSNPDIVYAGTGSDGIRSNIIVGKGVYKSEDGGKTWKHIGLEKTGQIGAVEIHPTNPDIVFVAAIGQPFQPNQERGVYRTTNGGNTWELVLHHSDTVGAVDLEFAPGDPNTLYAALWRVERKPWTIISGAWKAGGIYKSKDGGTSWKKITDGLPDGLIGKIDLAVSAQKPDWVYALVEAPGNQGGLYFSDNRGESFRFIENVVNKDLLERPFYYCNIEANPLDASTVYVLAEDMFVSRNGGSTWSKIRPLHGDQHDMWINPKDTSTMIESNDGGVSVTVNGGKTWTTQFNQPTAELYQVEVDDQHPYWVYAGQQDNTSIAIPSIPPFAAPAGEAGHWRAVGGCETGPSVPKPGNHNIVYSNCKGKFSVYNKLTGQEKQYYVGATNIYGHNPSELSYRFQRVAPVLVSKHNPDIVYHASQYVHRTKDEGVTWETISPDLTAFDPRTQVISGEPITRDITGEEFHSTIYALAESPRKQGVLWSGANDGPVYVTLDEGKTWKNVTPKGLPPAGRVQSIEASPHLVSKAYVTVLRYQLGDWHPYIYKTTDYGKSWTSLANGHNGIPADIPVRVVREDPKQQGLLFAGTESGMYISFDDGKQWRRFQQNLPVTPVTDLKIHEDDLILSTMGRSFWILDNINTIRQLAEAGNRTLHLFKPKDTYRYRYSASESGMVPHYPKPGITIDYYLEQATDTLQLEIINARGVVVQRFSNVSFPDSPQQSIVIDPALGVSTGLHRFRWDLRHRGAWSRDTKQRFQNGPWANPGEYTARLLANGQTAETTFRLLKDPRLTDVTDADLALQEGLCLQIRDLLDTARRMAHDMATAENIGKTGVSADELVRLERELVTEEGIYMKPMLIDQINYLRSMLDLADQRPGRDAYDRFRELQKSLYKLAAAYRKLKKRRPASP